MLYISYVGATRSDTVQRKQNRGDGSHLITPTSVCPKEAIFRRDCSLQWYSSICWSFIIPQYPYGRRPIDCSQMSRSQTYNEECFWQSQSTHRDCSCCRRLAHQNEPIGCKYIYYMFVIIYECNWCKNVYEPIDTIKIK